MANTQAIKRRIKSVKSTKQITKAMELVAASKMRRAQDATLKSRVYRNTALEIMTKISQQMHVADHELFTTRPIKRRLIIVITSDRGLAGAYNANVFKQLLGQCKQAESDQQAVEVIAIGRKGARFASRLESVELIAAYEDFTDNPTALDLQPILDTALEHFHSKKTDAVDVIFTDYASSITQEAKTVPLLPLEFTPLEDRNETDDAVFEPTPLAVLNQVAPKLVEVQLYQAILEAYASEHSMRMMAMKNASDNAGDIIDDLTLVFNSARQASITQELAEITGGAEAIA